MSDSCAVVNTELLTKEITKYPDEHFTFKSSNSPMSVDNLPHGRNESK